MKRTFFKLAEMAKQEPTADEVRCNACRAVIKVKDLADHKRIDCPMRNVIQNWKCYTKMQTQ